jgi:hypothetical protein
MAPSKDRFVLLCDFLKTIDQIMSYFVNVHINFYDVIETMLNFKSLKVIHIFQYDFIKFIIK